MAQQENTPPNAASAAPAAPLFEPFASPQAQTVVFESTSMPPASTVPTALPLPELSGWQEEETEILSRSLERYSRRFSCNFAKEEY